MAMQKRNDQMVDLLRADFQARYEPNFALANAISTMLALPGLRAFWPMSAVRKDGSAGEIVVGFNLTNNNSCDFGYDNLAPYVEFDGVNQYLSRADGGAANWADITGAEAYIEPKQQGLTLGGWVYVDTLVNWNRFISKWGAVGQRSYVLSQQLAANARWQAEFSWDGTNSEVVNTPVGSLVADTWYHLVMRVVPSATLDIYQNAVKTTTNHARVSIWDGAGDFVIGAETGGVVPMHGKASLCFLCAAALSDTIISNLFHQTRALFGV